MGGGATGDGGKKIEAIGQVRAITGRGLTEARALVESAPKAVKKGVRARTKADDGTLKLM